MISSKKIGLVMKALLSVITISLLLRGCYSNKRCYLKPKTFYRDDVLRLFCEPPINANKNPISVTFSNTGLNTEAKKWSITCVPSRMLNDNSYSYCSFLSMISSSGIYEVSIYQSSELLTTLNTIKVYCDDEKDHDFKCISLNMIATDTPDGVRQVQFFE